MKYKMGLIFVSLIICLFTLAGVCAGQANDTSLTALDLQDNIEINVDNSLMKTEVAADGSSDEAENDNNDVSASDNSGECGENMLGADLRANVIPINVSVADNTLFVIDGADDFKGNVSIKVEDNLLYNGSVKTLIRAGNLSAGDYAATAVFYGDSDYEELTLNEIIFTVSRVTPSIDVDIEDATYPSTAVALINLNNNANGTVNVTVDGRKFKGTVSGGKASVELIGLSAGIKEAIIEFFSYDDYNNDVRASAKFTVYPNNSLVDILEFKPTYYVGEDIEMKIKTHNSTGDLKIHLNGQYYSQLYYSYERVYVIDFSGLAEGMYTVTASLDGDENYTGYTTSADFEVVKNDLTIDLNDVVEDICVDGHVTFTASLNQSVTGDVIFSINGINYTAHLNNANIATYAYVPVNNATLNVVARFMGNDKYNVNESGLKQFNVKRIESDVDVSFDSPIIAGDDAVISVSMNPGITCTLQLSVDDKQYDVAIVNGNGRYTVSNLANATYNVKASYEGDERYAGSTSDVKKLYVNKVLTNLNIGIDKTSMSYHDFAVVSVVLDQAINSVVTVKVNGRNHTVGLVNGKGSLTLNGLDKSNYTICAVFAGDDKYVGSTSDSLNLTVTGDNITSSLSISLNTLCEFVGDDLVIKINSNPTVTGVVKLNIGSETYNVAVYKGVGTFTLSNLTNGNYEVQAVFEGDNQHYGSSSEIERLEINKIPTNLTISIDTPSVTVGNEAVVKVKSNPDMECLVDLIVGINTYGIVLTDGVGSLTVSNLDEGTYDVWAVFMGDNKYLGSSSDVKQLEVSRIPTAVSVSIDKSSAFVGDDIRVNVTLDQSVNNVVTVNVNGKSYPVAIVNGKGNLTLNNMAYGTYTVNATFSGDYKHLGNVSANELFEINKIKTHLAGDAIAATYNINEYAVITLLDTEGNAIGNVNVNVNFNGAKTLTTDSNGQIKLSTEGLAPDAYTARITFNGNAVYLGSSKEIKISVAKATPKITAKAKTFKKSVKTKKYSITLKNNLNKVMKNTKVTIKVGKKTYTAKTNKNGVATFKITKLTKKGTFNSVINYNGDKYYNKVTKTVKIKVK